MSEQLHHPPAIDHDSRTSGDDLSEADARFRRWMHDNLSHAADHFGLTITGHARLGWLDRSAGLPKPQVLDVYEWEEWRQQRAELMTLAPGSPCSPTDTLRHATNLPDQWWTELRRTIGVIAATPTGRTHGFIR